MTRISDYRWPLATSESRSRSATNWSHIAGELHAQDSLPSEVIRLSASITRLSEIAPRKPLIRRKAFGTRIQSRDAQSQLPVVIIPMFWSSIFAETTTHPLAATAASLSPAENIVAALRAHDRPTEAMQAVLDAEVTEFTPEQATQLRPLLRAFIAKNGNAKVEAHQVAAGAAIRTYIVLMPALDLEPISSLLQATLIPALENEVAKTTLRKLTANPADREELFPKLARELAALAESCLNARWVTRESFGAAAMNATLALALLRTSEWERVREAVGRIDAPWFRQVLRRQAEQLQRDLPAEGTEPQRQALAELIALGA